MSAAPDRTLRPVDASDFAIGDLVEWTPIVGSPRRGWISRFKGGRVYVRSSYTNAKGRRVSRMTECFFEGYELARLHVVSR